MIELHNGGSLQRCAIAILPINRFPASKSNCWRRCLWRRAWASLSWTARTWPLRSRSLGNTWKICMKIYEISMLLCPWWWFYLQTFSTFHWVLHGPFFLDKAHGNCSNSVRNPPTASSINLNSTVACSLPGQPLWPEKDLATMQCHSEPGATCSLDPFCTPHLTS